MLLLTRVRYLTAGKLSAGAPKKRFARMLCSFFITPRRTTKRSLSEAKCDAFLFMVGTFFGSKETRQDFDVERRAPVANCAKVGGFHLLGPFEVPYK